MIEFFIAADGRVALTTIENGVTALSTSRLKGRKLLEVVPCSKIINEGSWNANPFLTSDSVLYFSSSRNGNKDIFAAKLNTEGEVVGELFALNRINSKGNECAPFFDEALNIFYFSSDARPGFGNYDIFQCADFEIQGFFTNPFNERNCGATFNSHLADLEVSSTSNDLYLVQLDSFLNLTSKKLTRLLQESFDYDLKQTEIKPAQD
jgi:hypothetical protein